MLLLSSNVIWLVKNIEEGTNFCLNSYKNNCKSEIMAKGDRKRAKSGCYFKIRNKISPKGKKVEYVPLSGPSSTPDEKQSKGINSEDTKRRQL